MTDYDRPAGAFGSAAEHPHDELIVGRPEDEPIDEPVDEERAEEPPQNPETFADPEAAQPDTDRRDFEPAAGTETSETDLDQPDAVQPEAGQPGADEPVADQQTRPGEHRTTSTPEGFEPVFSTEHADEIQQRWRDVQASFVDDPQDAIARAGKLTDEVLSTLSTGLENRRRTLERDVTEGDTEQLRLAIRQYRLMLDHVLAL